jgi:hypothetical protein
MLTTALKRKAASSSGLILPDQFELSEIQRVIKVGPYVRTYEAVSPSISSSPTRKVSFGEGDWVKINFTRFVKPKSRQSLKDGNEFDETMLDFYIPIVEFAGDQYLEIDQGDVEYWWDKEVTE